MISLRQKRKIRIIAILCVTGTIGVMIYFMCIRGNLPLWVGILIALGATFANGVVAVWEDKRPGGFENPIPPKTSQTTSDTDPKT